MLRRSRIGFRIDATGATPVGGVPLARSVARVALVSACALVILDLGLDLGAHARAAAPDDPKPGEELVTEEVGHSLRPRVVDPTDERMNQLKLPAGFRVQKFAEDLGTPRMLRVGDDETGVIYRIDYTGPAQS